MKVTNGNNSVLLLDQYPAHINDFTIKEANKLNIKLIFIPKGKII